MTTTVNDVPTSISLIRDRFESMSCLNANFDETSTYSFRAQSTSALNEIIKSSSMPTTRRAAKPPPPKTKPKPAQWSTTLFNAVSSHSPSSPSSASSIADKAFESSDPTVNNAIGDKDFLSGTSEPQAVKDVEDDVFCRESSGSCDVNDTTSAIRSSLVVGISLADDSSAASKVGFRHTAFKTPPPPAARHRKQKTETQSESAVAMVTGQPATSISDNADEPSQANKGDSDCESSTVHDTEGDLTQHASPPVIRSTPPPPPARPATPPPTPPPPIPETPPLTPPSDDASQWIQLKEQTLPLAAADNVSSKNVEHRGLVISRTHRPKTIYPTETSQDVTLQKYWSSELCLTSHLSIDSNEANLLLPSRPLSSADGQLVSPTRSDPGRLPYVTSSLECSSEKDLRSSSINTEHRDADMIDDQATTKAGGCSSQKHDDNEVNVDIKQNGRLSVINQSAGNRKSYIIYAEQIAESFMFLDDSDDFWETDDEEIPPPPTPKTTTTDHKRTAENNAFRSTNSSSPSCSAMECHRTSDTIIDVNALNSEIVDGLSSSSAQSTSAETINSKAVRTRDIRCTSTGDIEDYKRLSIGRTDAISTIIDAFSFLEHDENA